jgi:hypothetical protein
MNSENGTGKFESLTLISLEHLNSSELDITSNLLMNLAEKGSEEDEQLTKLETGYKVECSKFEMNF